MAEMYLTEKLQQQLENSSISSINEQDGLDDEVIQPDMDNRQLIQFLLLDNGYMLFVIDQNIPLLEYLSLR